MNFPITPVGSPIYALMLLIGIAWGAVYWFRESKKDGRVALIYAAGLAGAFAGAKLAFLFAEGWLHFHDSNRWVIWLSGKSIMGALPGGWIGVEIAKKVLDYRENTGDRFAMLLPVPLILGRIGCLYAGCCGGIVCSFGTWPSVPVEIGFQVAAMVCLWVMRGRHWLTGQHFHVYLIAYGLFRFGHEFLRATPKPFGGLSGYQLLGLATAFAAVVAYRQRDSASRRMI
ncbi:MAG: prolipoprotein diacylglyceryl transferase family protein [Luteolibacter sp.]|uniref:prolipoprotein diacylglyceryl transferase family protein n=1 Tax=Luteolibacter sp. TaxID=1962973 RepID=UPI003267EAFB